MNIKRNFLSVTFSIALLLLCTQLIIDFSSENFLSSFFCFISFTVLIFYINKSLVFERYVSLIAIIGFNLTTMTGSFIFQTLFFKPMVYNLTYAVETFFALFLFQMTLIASHIVYCRSKFFLIILNKFKSQLLRLPCFYSINKSFYIYIFGFFGVAGTLFSISGDIEYGDSVSKFFFIFQSFLIFPFLIAFDENRKYKDKVTFLTIYSLLIFLISMAKNSRGTLVEGFFCVGLLFIFYLLSGQLKVDKKLIRRSAWLFFIFLVAGSGFIKVSDAMLIARSERAEVTPIELLGNTFEILIEESTANSDFIESYGRFNSYNEIYLDNPFLDRLFTTKFDNLAFEYGYELTQEDKAYLRDVEFTKAILSFPTPVLSFFNVQSSKIDYEFTIADAIYDVRTGLGAGGFKVPSFVGSGFIIFGYSFFFFYLLALPFLFLLLDIFSVRLNGVVKLSPVFILLGYSIFTLFSVSSFSRLFGFFVRAIPQTILLYVFVVVMCSVLMRVRLRS